jgi:hypothetical protein
MKITLLIYATFVSGLLIRLYNVFGRPLWLDEQFSLAFATYYSYIDLLTRLPDTHPGGYYFLLKFALTISHNLPFLRIVTSVIPEMLGLISLYMYFQKKEKGDSLRLLVFSFITFCNPFFIYMSWQMRMYGYVIFFASLSYIGYREWYKKRTWNNLLFMGLPFVIGNMISPSFLLLSFVLCITIAISDWRLKRKEKTFIIFICIVIIELLFYLVGHPKDILELGVSWITYPSVKIIPFVIFTSLGLGIDFNYSAVRPGYVIAAAWIYVGFIFIFLKNWFYKFKKYSFMIVPLIWYFLVTYSISLLLPIASTIHGIRSFIPNISLFIPRIFLPVSVWLYASIVFAHTGVDFRKPWKKYIKEWMVFIVYFCIFMYSLFKADIFFEKTHPRIEQIQIHPTMLFWPPWSPYTLISTSRWDDIASMHAIAIQSEKFSFNITNIDDFACKNTSIARDSLVFFSDDVAEKDMVEAKKILSYLQRCCREKINGNREGNVEKYSVWICNESKSGSE